VTKIWIVLVVGKSCTSCLLSLNFDN
jgi:hypothetical protein